MRVGQGRTFHGRDVRVPSTPTLVSQASTEPPSPGEGAVTRTTPGGAATAAIMRVSTAASGLSGSVRVVQLYVQGGNALADLKSETGKRAFVALSGGPDAWRLVWSAPFGSPEASAKALTAKYPGAFTELAAAVDFQKSVPDAVTAPAGSAAPGSATAAQTPTLTCLKASARETARQSAGAGYTGDFTVQAKIAKDSAGTWWGNAVAKPTVGGADTIGVWSKWDGKKWVDEIATTGSGSAPASHFPASVASKLGL